MALRIPKLESLPQTVLMSFWSFHIFFDKQKNEIRTGFRSRVKCVISIIVEITLLNNQLIRLIKSLSFSFMSNSPTLNHFIRNDLHRGGLRLYIFLYVIYVECCLSACPVLFCAVKAVYCQGNLIIAGYHKYSFSRICRIWYPSITI